MNIDKETKKSDLQFWIERLEFWKVAITQRNGYPSMIRYNNARKRLAKAIREAETKLNRPHRYLPKLGCVQYIKETP